MSRRLANWLDGYYQYIADTESPMIFHKWTAFSLIAAALQKKVWFNFGRIKIYPNLFVVLVSEPGIARKTQAINFGEEIVSQVSQITTSADAITPQAMLEDLEAARMEEQMRDGSTLIHNSLFIMSGEFESFLGQKGDNQKMVVLLTDLFDCKTRPYRYRTKHSGSNNIESPFLTLLAATTPDSLASALPARAIGGGLTSRILFPWAEDKGKKVAIPGVKTWEDLLAYRKDDPEIQKRKLDLISDLDVIHRMSGSYNYTEESFKWWNAWYNSYDERDPGRLCKDTAFKGWYSRKPLFVLKLGMILSASKRNTMTVTSDEFEEALVHLEEIEAGMENAFVAVGKSDIAAEVAEVTKIIRQEGIIAEKFIRQRTWRDIDDTKFDNVIKTIVNQRIANRIYTHPDTGAKGIWYVWARKEKGNEETSSIEK